MSNHLSIQVELNRPNIPSSNYSDELLYAVLTIQPQAISRSQRPPLNLCIVLDSSATMYNFQLSDEERETWMSLALSRNEMERGSADERDAVYWSGETLKEMQASVRKPMSMAVQAIKHLLRELQHGDKASLIVFADQSHTLFSDTQWVENPESCIQNVDKVLDQDIPIDIGTGTKLAPALAAASDLIQANSSESTIDRIIVISDGFLQDYRETLSVVSDVQQKGYAVTTLGVGDEFDEEFLMRVSDNTRGAYYYAANIDEITEKLVAEMTLINATSLQHLYVRASGESKSVVQDIFMARPYMTIFDEMETGDGWVRAHVGDLPSDVSTGLLVQIAPSLQSPGEQIVASVEFSWRENGALVEQSADIKANYTDDEGLIEKRNADIQDLVNRFNVYKYEREAQKASERGNIGLAKEKLGAATKELRKMGEESLAKDVESHIATMGGNEQDPSLAKRIKSATRKLGDK
jgi:Ca-activated chloride channel family protein